MRVHVDRDRCEGNAICVGIAPDLFELDDDDYASFRGAADGLALRLAHSDDALHATLAPSAPAAARSAAGSPIFRPPATFR